MTVPGHPMTRAASAATLRKQIPQCRHLHYLHINVFAYITTYIVVDITCYITINVNAKHNR